MKELNCSQSVLFDYVKDNFYLKGQILVLKSDLTAVIKAISTKELCKILDINLCAYSLMYNNKRPVGPGLIIKIHECTNLSVALIKSMLQ